MAMRKLTARFTSPAWSSERSTVSAIKDVMPAEPRPDPFQNIVGNSFVIKRLRSTLMRLALSSATVLVQGESGAGKEGVASALHLGGNRADKPFVVVNCAALPNTLIEAELFGHERGAFTGAVARNTGAFERADGGTLFLDEIGELPLEAQAKLLRALETGVVRRIGAANDSAVNVRVVAATNRDLEAEAAAGKFRKDLYYRLAIVTVCVPPLRDRLEDVPELVQHLARRLDGDVDAVVDDEMMARMQEYHWPGNVRELRNCIARAIALGERVAIQPSDKNERNDANDSMMAAGSTPPVPDIDVSLTMREGRKQVLEAFDRAYLLAQLAQCRGNISEVARRSGMDRMSIHRILGRLQLEHPLRYRRA